MSYEVAKALMQLVGVAVVGTAVSLATFNYQWSRDHNRELQQRRDELLRSLLNDTLTSYNAVKRSRRLLRAKVGATIATGSVDLETYDEQLAIISDEQLEFERLKKSTEILDDDRIDSSHLREKFRRIERYLSNLVTEYERERRVVAETTDAVTGDRLSHLSRFIDKSDNTSFKQGIGAPVDSVLRLLREALLKPLRPAPPLAKRSWWRPRRTAQDGHGERPAP